MLKGIEVPQRVISIEWYAIADVLKMAFDELMVEFDALLFFALNFDLPLIIKMVQSILKIGVSLVECLFLGRKRLYKHYLWFSHWFLLPFVVLSFCNFGKELFEKQ